MVEKEEDKKDTKRGNEKSGKIMMTACCSEGAGQERAEQEGDSMKEEETRSEVRKEYARIAMKQSSCCGSLNETKIGKKIGYTEKELASVPKGANMGLGCGNPTAIASLKEGELVIDLGSGGGFDCFLAARKVGDKGKVIGVDMTPEMIDKARENARKGGFRNVEFRLGEIENLPVADNTADVVISNCVINLSPDKKRVFEDAFRVLKPGGRLMVSDIVLIKKLSETVRRTMQPGNCVANAIIRDRYIDVIMQAGFPEVRIVKETQQSYEDAIGHPNARAIIRNADGGIEEIKLSEASEETKSMIKEIANSTASIEIMATRP
jgi:arsenite methyltransferase